MTLTDTDTDGLLDEVTTHGVQRSQKGFTCRRCMIIPVILCYFFGLGIIVYASPEYIQHVVKNNLGYTNESIQVNPCNMSKSDPLIKAYDKVQQETAHWTIYFNLANFIPALFGNLVWGSYSDVLGRRVQFMVCTFGAFVRSALFVIVIHFELSLTFMVIGYLVEGLTGGYACMFAAIFAFVSDVTNVGKERTTAIIAFEVMIGFAIVIVSFATGYVIQAIGFFGPALIICILSLVSFLTTIFFLPETMQRDLSKTRPNERSIWKTLSSSFSIYVYNDSKWTTIRYLLLISAFLFIGIASISRGSLEILYQLGRPFCWSPTKIGWFGATKIGISSVAVVVGVKLLHRCLADDTIAVVAAFFGTASFVVEGLATTNAVLYTVPVIGAWSLLPIPMIRSLMSSITSPEKQGALFASLGIVETLSSLLGSLTNNFVYAATLSIMNGFVFLLSAGITFIGMCLLMVFMYVQRRKKEDTVVLESEIIG